MRSHIPPKRQSLKPTRAVVIALAGVALVLLSIIVAVGWASSSSSGCPAGNTSNSKCQ